MTQTYFAPRPGVIPDLTDERQHRKALARGINDAMNGQTGNTFAVTLTAGATSTTIIDPRISISTACHLAPMTASAAAALPGIFIVPSAGQAIINHPSGSGDQTYIVSIQG
jgi:hypothetical protein